MTPRQRVHTAMGHKEPDRVPLFYRDTPEVERRLLGDLGLADREALLRRLEIDFRWVAPEYVGPPLEDPATGRRRDIWGVEYHYVPFSQAGGYWEPVANPLADCEDPAALADYPWPRLEWFDFSTLGQQVARHADYAIMTAGGFASPGVLLPAQQLCGAQKAWMDMACNPVLTEALIERVMEFLLPFTERMLTAAGGGIDFFRIGDDFGTQRGLLIGPEHWRRFLQPPLRALADVAHKRGAWYYHHSCGSVRELIGDLIATGADVLDPVQVKAVGMAPRELKAEFGNRICFSGGVDEQELLPRGTGADVARGVRDLLADMAPGGGFFIGPTHNFQVDIPTENIVAMYETARRWRY